jgi:hypothetical protein
MAAWEIPTKKSKTSGFHSIEFPSPKIKPFSNLKAIQTPTSQFISRKGRQNRTQYSFAST